MPLCLPLSFCCCNHPSPEAVFDGRHACMEDDPLVEAALWPLPFLACLACVFWGSIVALRGLCSVEDGEKSGREAQEEECRAVPDDAA